VSVRLERVGSVAVAGNDGFVMGDASSVCIRRANIVHMDSEM
jgi:hypothetical protein